MLVREGEFVAYRQSRMADPSQTRRLIFGYIWYQPLSKEVMDTWHWLPHNFFFLTIRPPPISPLFPHPTLFRWGGPGFFVWGPHGRAASAIDESALSGASHRE